MHATGRPLRRQVDLNLLELFDVVYQLRNLTATGERLGLSQPAVSYGLRRLREAYGDALFVRMQRGVQPTPYADKLAKPLAQALQIVRDTIVKAEFLPKKSHQSFRIAMSDIGERLFLPYLMAWLADEAAGVSIETVAPPLPELAAGLVSGEIDAALGFFPGLGKQVHQQILFTEQFVYLLRVGHPAAGKTLAAAQARRYPHVIAGPLGTEHASEVERVLRQPKFRAVIALRVRSFLSLAPIVAGSDLIALIPSNLAVVVARNVNVQVATPPIRFPTFDVSMYWHSRLHQDPANVWLRQSLDRLFRKARAFDQEVVRLPSSK